MCAELSPAGAAELFKASGNLPVSADWYQVDPVESSRVLYLQYVFACRFDTS
jgi:hypothetical protein